MKLFWHQVNGRWFVDLGFERVPIGCKVEVEHKDGRVKTVYIRQRFQGEDGHWYGSPVYKDE